MLLLYLYTLDNPLRHSMEWADAERACLVGDKYQVSGLKTAGDDWILDSIRTNLKRSVMPLDSGHMDDWCHVIRRLWTGGFPDPDTIKTALLKNIVTVANYFLKVNDFQKLLKENEEFNSEFIAALVKKVCGA